MCFKIGFFGGYRIIHTFILYAIAGMGEFITPGKILFSQKILRYLILDIASGCHVTEEADAWSRWEIIPPLAVGLSRGLFFYINLPG